MEFYRHSTCHPRNNWQSDFLHPIYSTVTLAHLTSPSCQQLTRVPQALHSKLMIHLWFLMTRAWGEGKLIDQLNQWLDSNLGSDLGDGAESDENDLEWYFKEGETWVKGATYVFCLAPHQKQILHLFTKHFCQHLIFPEQNEGSCSAAEIHECAVMEMYQFCWQWWWALSALSVSKQTTWNTQLPRKVLLLAKTEITKRTSTHAKTRLCEEMNICWRAFT